MSYASLNRRMAMQDGGVVIDWKDARQWGGTPKGARKIIERETIQKG